MQSKQKGRKSINTWENFNQPQKFKNKKQEKQESKVKIQGKIIKIFHKRVRKTKIILRKIKEVSVSVFAETKFTEECSKPIIIFTTSDSHLLKDSKLYLNVLFIKAHHPEETHVGSQATIHKLL